MSSFPHVHDDLDVLPPLADIDADDLPPSEPLPLDTSFDDLPDPDGDLPLSSGIPPLPLSLEDPPGDDDIPSFAPAPPLDEPPPLDPDEGEGQPFAEPILPPPGDDGDDLDEPPEERLFDLDPLPPFDE